MKAPELLLPAWDLEKAYIAFRYWADAIYAWIPAFSLRTRMNVFKEVDIEEIVWFAHKNNKKVYITLNAFPHQWLINSLEKHLKFLSKVNPDWLIIADTWVLYLANKICPNIAKHLSVQASTVSESWMRFWYESWVRRIILAREISVSEIVKIHNLFPEMELEYFIHWAVCMAYSGRCLLSNFLASRDSNRGMCAHSCRWKYRIFDEEGRCLTAKDDDWICDNIKFWNGNSLLKSISKWIDWEPISIRDFEDFQFWEEEQRKWEFIPVEQDFHWTHIMSSRDMCMIEHLKEITGAWVVSLKIEWRNKTIYYLASVARAYRKALYDIENWNEFDQELFDEIHSTANRGFFEWFLHWKPSHLGQQYEANRSTATHEFCWKILKIYKKWDILKKALEWFELWYVFKEDMLYVNVRNRIDKDNKLIFVYPNISDDKSFIAWDFYKHWKKVDIIHWWDWNAFIVIPSHMDIENWILIRQEVRNEWLKV